MKPIGVDIDGVLADTSKRLPEVAKAWYGLDILPEQITCFQVENCTPLTANQTKEIFGSSEYYRGAPAIPGAGELMRQLKRIGLDLFLTTARPWEVYQTTVDWLRAKRIHFDYISHDKDKTIPARKFGFLYFIEDNFDTCCALAEVCRLVFLVDSPWNQGAELPLNVLRVFELLEIPPVIEADLRTNLI